MQATSKTAVSSGGITTSTPNLSWSENVNTATELLSDAVQETFSELKMVNSSAVMAEISEDEGVLLSEDQSEESVPSAATCIQDAIAKKIFETIREVASTLSLPTMSEARAKALRVSLAAELSPPFMKEYDEASASFRISMEKGDEFIMDALEGLKGELQSNLRTISSFMILHPLHHHLSSQQVCSRLW